MSDKVILKGYLLVPEHDLDVVKEELPRHIELTRNEPGCIAFEVNQDEDNQCRFNVYEEFVDRAAFEAHQERVRQSSWGIETKSAERNYTITYGS